MTKRRASTDIKLLRLELKAKPNSPCEDIGFEWVPAQPAVNLTPTAAAESLQVDEWAPASEIRARYKKLLLRYPPEQFSAKHLTWRPAFELLSDPVSHLNWYWQSGGFLPLKLSTAEQAIAASLKSL